MTPEEAATLVDLLLESHRPATSSWGARVLEYGRAERSGDPERVARALGELYAETTLSSAQELMVTRLEGRLLGNLATALKEPVGKLRARLRAGRAIFSGDAAWSPEEADGPEAVSSPPVEAPPGWEHRHTFRVFGDALVLGSQPDDVERTLTLTVPNGAWHVFAATPQSWLGRLLNRTQPVLVAVHDGALLRAAILLGRARAIDRTEDRYCSLVDAAARRDARIRALIGNGAPSGRSYTFITDDHEHEWLGARDDDDRLVLLTTALDSEE